MHQPVVIKWEHPCLLHCWQLSTGCSETPFQCASSSSSCVASPSHDSAEILNICWASMSLAEHRPVRLSSQQNRDWTGLPPIQASPARLWMCESKRRGVGKGGVEKLRERGRKREGTGRVVVMLVQRHKGRRDPRLKCQHALSSLCFWFPFFSATPSLSLYHSFLPRSCQLSLPFTVCHFCPHVQSCFVIPLPSLSLRTDRLMLFSLQFHCFPFLLHTCTCDYTVTHTQTHICLGTSQQSGAVRLQYLSSLRLPRLIVPEKQQSLKPLIGL